ncbi:GMC oxidoreductase [Hydrogenophaga sp.]|uniref:GMC oxidoreductase n=1 Tax=Hydrogenophaga sp. TaxID=1904254 RepID=UPI003F70A6C2
MNELVNREWDVIVVGTGVGGGTAGRALAESGKSVLFIEKGRQGFRAERNGLNAALEDPTARAIRGWWPDPVHATINGKQRSFFAPLGSGAGGSSVFYAATLERPESHDFDDEAGRPHPTGGWPTSAQAMQPWYEAAEVLYGVRGSHPPQADPSAQQARPTNAADAAVMEGLRRNGLKPYRLHSGIRHLDGCLECVGVKCPRPCKMDGRSAGLEPALATGNAALLDQCEVMAFGGRRDHIDHVKVIRDGHTFELRAKQFVLAAGALSSPRLLLASRTDYWPDGCANGNDQVGRHLMFHLNEMFAVWPRGAANSSQASKSVGLRDLYMLDGQRMGMVQAMGVNVSYGEIVHFIKQRLQDSALRRLAPLAPLAAGFASLAMGQAKLFVGLLEDLPYTENRVVFNPERPAQIRFEYTLHPELIQRRKQYRKAIKRAFRGMRPAFIDWRPDLNYGHPCGTLRSGNDPRNSVLNAECRAHEIDNLYVADASFFPTSTGVNPSLTIAANALRVAHLMSNKP